MASSYNVYQTGDAVILTADFKDAAGVAADPSEVRLRVKRSSGEVDDVIPERQATGRWRGIYSLTGKAQGEYRYRWTGLGDLQVAGEGAFYVLPISVPN